MNRFIDWRIFCSVMAVASSLAFGLHAWIGLTFWACLGLVVFGIIINGIIATIEDEMPGFHNPKPDGRRDEPKKGS